MGGNIFQGQKSQISKCSNLVNFCFFWPLESWEWPYEREEHFFSSMPPLKNAYFSSYRGFSLFLRPTMLIFSKSKVKIQNALTQSISTKKHWVADQNNGNRTKNLFAFIPLSQKMRTFRVTCDFLNFFDWEFWKIFWNSFSQDRKTKFQNALTQSIFAPFDLLTAQIYRTEMRNVFALIPFC